MRFPRPPAPLRLIILLFIIVRVHLPIGAVCGPPTDVIDVFANGVSFLIGASAPPLCSPCFRSPSLLPLHWCVLVQPRVPFPMVFFLRPEGGCSSILGHEIIWGHPGNRDLDNAVFTSLEWHARRVGRHARVCGRARPPASASSKVGSGSRAWTGKSLCVPSRGPPQRLFPR